MSVDDKKIIYSMIKVSKYYDNKPVIKDISLSYFYGAKIGVLGLNGSGKSTLLRILAGIDTEFNGETILSPGLTIDYLPQEPTLDPDKTVRQIVEESVQDTVDLIKEFSPGRRGGRGVSRCASQAPGKKTFHVFCGPRSDGRSPCPGRRDRRTTRQPPV